MVLAFGPGNRLYLHAAARAIDPAHGIDEKDGDAPQRKELKTSGRHRVVAGGASPATRADRPAAVPGPNIDIKDRGFSRFPPAGRTVSKTSMLLDLIQDRFDQHPGSLRLVMG
ncbi:hypothetical protein DESUT3_10750 [Desulfuromonas versatilis]|uniref:Uncharacterized protein n=1 Tax=Desulfuromonas versatilis TaxID=2802975 RepID=A0ABN6DV60_9BACT|nr:hypothetical protein DESUT3_10750 [Desulfuromonas versatilis]